MIRQSALAGLSTASAAIITAADNVLSALGKLQAQISGLSVSTYGSAGPIVGVKVWQGTVTTTAGGAWTVNYANAGFSAPPVVVVQAVSSSSLLTGLVFATMTMPTATTVSGVTALAGTGGLGAAGTMVMIRATGT